MQIRTRVASRSSALTVQQITPVSVGKDGYLKLDDTASLIQEDETLLGIATLDLDGTYVLSMEISDTELEELLCARLQARASDTLGVIGRAITSSSGKLNTSQSRDALENLPITRTVRNSVFTRGWRGF